ncbi:MAG: hypothetical protein J6R82_07120 [Clostridia bacterium]|nr:hypothetical protein [Clostridia bacterium]
MEAYQNILHDHLSYRISMCILSLLIVGITFVLLKILPRRIGNTTWRSTTVYLIGWCVVILGLIACFVQGYHAVNIAIDLSEQSYMTYTGEFHWDEQEGRSSMDKAELVDINEKVSAMWATYTLVDGDYTGKVVYSRRSKIIVEIETCSY